MASSSKLIFIFLLLIASSFSIEIQARQFFNKVSGTAELEEPRKQQPSPEQQQQQEQDPSFYAQTSESSSYGLYGGARDSDHSHQQLTPTTATTSSYKPYVTPVRYHPDEPFNAIPNNNNNQNLQESRLGERSTFYSNDEDDNDDENSTPDHASGKALQQQQQNNNNNNNFEDEAILFQEIRNNNNNGGGSEDVMRSERQAGMSDTRFLEKGKYYYDINSERSSSGANKYPQSGGSDASHVISYNNNNGYGNLQGRRNANYNSNLQKQEEFQQFHDQP